MASRANWKGFLKVGEVSCRVALYAAASTSDRVSFHILNRETGHRVRRQFVDSETGKPVEQDSQVRGYEIAGDEFIVLEPEEIAAAVPESDKTLSIDAFIDCDDVSTVYLDRPYYLAPADQAARDVYALIHQGMSDAKVAAIAHTVLFRRMRAVLIRPHGPGLIATTLNFDYEIRSADEVFAEIPRTRIKGEMLDLAKHIIQTKHGEFHPQGFDDRYEDALAAVVKAKAEGKPIEIRKERASAKVIDLMEALRRSAGKERPGGARATTKNRTPRRRARAKRKSAAPRRKAG